MTTSAYTRIHEAEVRHTVTLTDADLTDDDRDALAWWDAVDDSGASLEISSGRGLDRWAG